MRCLKMLNKDLIEKLKEYNPNADVSLVDSEDITIGFICKTGDGKNFTPQTTPQLFIEGVDLCPTCVHEYIEDRERMCSFYGKPCRMVGECFQFEEYDER